MEYRCPKCQTVFSTNKMPGSWPCPTCGDLVSLVNSRLDENGSLIIIHYLPESTNGEIPKLCTGETEDENSDCACDIRLVTCRVCLEKYKDELEE